MGRKLKEVDIEDYGRKRAKQEGWMMEKFTSPQKRSVPDDIFTVKNAPSAFIFFIEFKRPGEEATELQQIDHRKRRELGGVVFVVDCFAQLDMAFEIVQYVLLTGEIPEVPPYLLK